jgi:hypothetical protein
MEYQVNPQENIGKIYRRGMLPYGGAVSSRGIITMVVSEEDYRRDMDRLKSVV